MIKEKSAVDSFINQLRQFKGKFIVRESTGQIRTQSNLLSCLCPMKVVANVAQGQYPLAATRLGLTLNERTEIVVAADARSNCLNRKERNLRRRLLRALDLKEPRVKCTTKSW